MLKSRTPFVVVCVLFLAYYSAAHGSCSRNSRSLTRVRSAERCAAKCQYSERYGECVAWHFHPRYSGNCYLYYIDRDVSYGSYDYCGAVPPAATNSSTDPPEEAPGSEPAPTGCYIDNYEDLGYSTTKESCEQACRGLTSNRYSACVAWFWDEYDNECIGYLVEASSSYTCGTP